MNLAKTLLKLIEKENLNTLELSRRTGICQAVIYRITTGETDNPKIATICSLADYFGITVNQLIGESPLPEFDETTKSPKLFSVPLFSWEEIVKWPDIDSKSIAKLETIATDLAPNPNIYALKVANESMEPLFPKNTILIINGDLQPKDHNYVIVKLGKSNTAIFRQLLIDDDLQYLKPLNPDSEKYKMNLFNSKTDKYLGALIQARMNCNE